MWPWPHQILSVVGYATSIIFRCADSESVEYARDTIGTEFNTYTGHVEKSSLPTGGTVTTSRETKKEEEHSFYVPEVQARGSSRLQAGRGLRLRPDSDARGVI